MSSSSRLSSGPFERPGYVGQTQTSRRAQATAPFRMYRSCRPGLATFAGSGCAAKHVPLATPPVIDSHDRHVRELQRDLATILDTPALRHGVLAASVKSLTAATSCSAIAQTRW